VTTGTRRLAVAIGEPLLEAAVQDALEAAGHQVTRCLAAGDLLACLRTERVAAALVGSTLYQLGADRWAELSTCGVPLLLRADAADAGRFPGAAALLAPDLDAAALAQAVAAVAQGRPAASPGPVMVETPPAPGTAPAEAAPARRGRVLAITGAGGAGSTTLTANLALALALVQPVAAVDANLASPALAAALDGDSSRHLVALAQAAPRDGAEWERVLGREGQPLHHRCPQGMLFCGLPRPEQRGALGRAFSEQLLAELRRRYAWVLLDTGGDILAPDCWLQRTALLGADDVLLVVRPDPLGIKAAQTLLGVWERQLHLPEARLALAVNGYERRLHPPLRSIAWHLGLPLAAVLPADHAALHRAQLERRPALFAGGRFADALLAFADRLHGGDPLRLPEEVRRQQAGKRWWRRVLRRLGLVGGRAHGGDLRPAA
jgi:Mrp family chromosome partitioning ATPase